MSWGPVEELSPDASNGIVRVDMICFPPCLGLTLGGIESESQLPTWLRKDNSFLPIPLLFVVLQKHRKMYMSPGLGWWNEINWQYKHIKSNADKCTTVLIGRNSFKYS